MFIQEQIANARRRIKNIEENPRPEYMKCNKLLYEIELEEWLELEENWKAGKPFAMLSGAGRLTRPLGFEACNLSGWGDRVRDPQKYRNMAVSKFGFPDHTCDRTMPPVALYLNGEVPIPRLISCMHSPCGPEGMWAPMSIAKYMGIPFFELLRLEKGKDKGDKSVRFVAEQLAELIEFAEATVPGIKYDEDKLIESLAMDQQAAPYLRDLYELRKKVPCPVSSQDAARLGLRPGGDCNPKGMQYLKLYHEEAHERAAKGIGGVKEEKLRIAWTSTFNYGRGTMDLLTKKGVSLVWFNNGTGPQRYCAGDRDPYETERDYGRKLTPLEEIATYHNYNTWGHGADEWIDPLIKICRDLKVDALVDFQQVGCIVTRGFNKITADRVTKELGIPVLALEGREHFMTEGEKTIMYQRLEEFLDLCIANKN